MVRTGGHSFRALIVAIATVTGIGAAGAFVFGRAPVARATLTSTSVGAATGASITIMPGACSGGGFEFCFKPESVTVAVGTAVVWTNQTGVAHTTSSCTAAACPGAPANTGSNTFSNPVAAANGSTASFTFTSAGTYTYYCMIHGYAAMHGKIIVVGAGPAVSKFTPTSGRAGIKVTITGHNLAHATSVKFNGTSAVISSDSTTRIVVKVPVGATTGKIAITTSSGTATSAKVFTVT
jgi:plastocyanin